MEEENNRIEYKATLDDDKDEKLNFEKEVIAFLNYREGGTIFVGIDKFRKVYKIDNVDELQLKITDKIKNNIRPSTLGLFDVIVEKVENESVIKISISSGPEKPYYLYKHGMTPNGTYIRVGSSKQKMTTDMINDMLSRRTRNSLNKIEAPRQDLTFKQLNIYYQDKGLELNETFEKTLELITPDGKYNYNAYLLADENSTSIKFAKYRGTDKIDLIQNVEYGYCCLIKATERLLDKVNIENITSAKITYKNRIEKQLVDKVAIREAIINAIIHNDWTSEIPPIVEMFSDRFSITSTGRLPQELTQEDFFDCISAPRNQTLMRIFKDMDLVEQLGSGMRRILQVYTKDNFKFFQNFIRIEFYFDKEVLEYLEEKAQEKAQEKKIINEKVILDFCKEPKTLKEIIEYFGYKNARRFRENYINALLEQEKLEMTIPNQPKNRNQKYVTVK
jgi:predicted HTH transcriptional regulator